MSFENLGLAPVILSAVAKAGFTEPTPVQLASIPKALQGLDLMVSAQTGSGKTAAFMLPALSRIANTPAGKGTGVQVLVLTPTRELAMQIAAATKTYGAHIKDLRIATVVGGMPYGAQLKALSRRVDVLVATPGRLIDHLQSGRVNLSTVHTLVLDEADRMLDMGFIEDIETIVSRVPEQRQTLLFSATLDGSIANMAGKMMRNAEQIEVSGHHKQHTNITQSLLYADDNGHKMRLLDHLLRDTNLDQAIVFTATKRGADDLANRLADEGFSAAALHGDMNQRQRTRTLGLLQRHQLRILVATDVAARGIDVQGISHAINYDLPMQPEDYTHRIGRTGRAGHSGLAFTLAMHSERHKVRRIEHFIGQPIPTNVIEGLEPKKTVRPTYTDRKGGKSFGGSAGRGGFGGKPSHARSTGFGSKSGYPRNAKPGFGGKPEYARNGDSGFNDKPSFAGKPRFDDKRAYESRPASGERVHDDRFARKQDRGYAGQGAERSFGGEERRSFTSRNEDRRGGYKDDNARSNLTQRSSFGGHTSSFGDRSKPEARSRDRASFGDRQSSFSDRGGFGNRTARDDKPASGRSFNAPRAERPAYEGKPARSAHTSFSDRSAAPRSDFNHKAPAKFADRPARPGFGSKPATQS
ncbi:MAG: DEAD/DEAH box helicase [Burkholderiaceae bacterium]|nr:MAG: DEAD/DEAH box helicase [Burkholderiaceae bacterium]TAM09095.1 MAG: DEAD/DEAH box helicase [Pusillimonas sp.]